MDHTRAAGAQSAHAVSGPRVQANGRWRKHVHIAFGGCALLLRWLPFSGVVACAIAAVVFNLFLLPRIRPLVHVLYREREAPGGVGGGIFWYPIAVLLAVLVFPLPIAAAGWGFLAVGDGMAALVGQRMASRPLPWNPAKSRAGTAALFACGTAAAVAVFLLVRHNLPGYPPWWRATPVTDRCVSLGHAALAGRMAGVGVVAAALESLPLARIDDNLTVPLGSGAVLLASFMV